MFKRPAVQVALFALATLVLKGAAALRLEPSTLEAYYWHYGQHPALSYHDHPGMTGWMLWLSTSIFGDGLLGFRVLSLVAGTLSIGLMFLAGRRLFDEKVGRLAALLAGLVPMFVIYGARATPDSPLLLFWTATLWALAHALGGGRPAWWYAAGLFLGLALDSKYSAIFLPLGVLGFLLSPDQRGWLRRKEPYIAVAIALAVFSPTLIWNAQHEWRSLAYQGAGRFAEGRPLSWKTAYQFPMEQMALMTPVVAAAAWLFGIRALFQWRNSSWAVRLLAATSLPLLLFFLPVSFVRSVVAHWTAPGYVGAILLVAAGGFWRRAHLATLWGLALLLAALPVALFVAPKRNLEGWKQLAHTVGRFKPDFVVAADYRYAAELGYFLRPIPACDLKGYGGFNDWWNPKDHLGANAVIVDYADRPTESLADAFDRVEPPVFVTASRWGSRSVPLRIRRAFGYRGSR
jgi:4-amino-4-deoxy-L-arabinose transferase-like glycosyltransferase